MDPLRCCRRHDHHRPRCRPRVPYRTHISPRRKNELAMKQPCWAGLMSMIPSPARNRAHFLPSWRPGQEQVAAALKWLLLAALLILSSIPPPLTHSCPPSDADFRDTHPHSHIFCTVTIISEHGKRQNKVDHAIWCINFTRHGHRCPNGWGFFLFRGLGGWSWGIHGPVKVYFFFRFCFFLLFFILSFFKLDGWDDNTRWLNKIKPK